MTFKRPFGKDRPESLAQPLDEAPPQPSLKGPSLTLGKGGKKNIYDALKKEDDDSKTDEVNDRKSIQFRPDLRRKKEIKLPTRHTEQEIVEKDDKKIAEVPRPTPLLRGRKPFGAGRSDSKENILLRNPSPSSKEEVSSNENEIEDSSVNLKPNLNFRKLEPQINYIEPELNRKEEIKPQIITPVAIDLRNIKENSTAVSISDAKVLKQNQRVADLSKMLNLEMDTFENLLSVDAVALNDIYIGKLKAGYIKNSCFQAFDDKISQQSQTQSLNYNNHSAQAPQDYYGMKESINNRKVNSEDALAAFLVKVSPVIEELVRPSSNVTSPPTSLLAFQPIFKGLLQIPYPVFNYYSENFGIGILVISSKLFITNCEIVCATSLGSSIIAGLKDGNIALWDGFNDYKSSLYDQIFSQIQSTNFELPSFITNNTDRHSSYLVESSICGLSAISSSQIWSIDSGAKLIKWKLETRIGESSYLKPQASIDIEKLIIRNTIIAYSLKERLGSLFANTSAGVVCLHAGELTNLIDPKVKILQMELPRRPALIFLVCADQTYRIYSETSSQNIAKLELPVPLGGQLNSIMLPEIEYEGNQIFYRNIYIGKELYILYYTIVSDSLGNIYIVSTDENGWEPVTIHSVQQKEESRDILYHGCILRAGIVERFHLNKNLNCEVEQLRLNISLTKSVANMKKILSENRKFMTEIENESYICL